jgi:hypothetical protein
MYFGGIRGFNAFDPARVEDNPLVPPVIITAFKKFNQTERKDLTAGESITLQHADNFISFEFAALDYSAPEKNQYAYQLVGFDRDWVHAGTRRYASYTNLRSGSYTFRVIGSNQDGVWNETGASVDITVVPPFWESWWFLGALGLALTGGSVSGYRYRVTRIQNQNRQLEEQVIERTQEIERRREVAEGLREIINILNSNRSLKESLDAIIVQAVRVMGARGVVLFRCMEDNIPLVIASNLYDRGAAMYNQGTPALPDWLAQPVLQGQTVHLPDLLHQRAAHPDLESSALAATRRCWPCRWRSKTKLTAGWCCSIKTRPAPPRTISRWRSASPTTRRWRSPTPSCATRPRRSPSRRSAAGWPATCTTR